MYQNTFLCWLKLCVRIFQKCVHISELCAYFRSVCIFQKCVQNQKHCYTVVKHFLLHVIFQKCEQNLAKKTMKNKKTPNNNWRKQIHQYSYCIQNILKSAYVCNKKHYLLMSVTKTSSAYVSNKIHHLLMSVTKNMICLRQ